MLKPAVRAGVGLGGFLCLCGGTFSHRLVGVGADVALSVGVGEGPRAGAGFSFWIGSGFGFGFSFSIGIGIDLSCLPGCSFGLSSGFLGPPVCVRSACFEPSRPPPAVSAFLFSLWARSIAATTLATISMMSFPHGMSFWWYASHFSSFSSNHVFIPRHCAYCSAVWVFSMVAIFEMVRCSCAS